MNKKVLWIVCSVATVNMPALHAVCKKPSPPSNQYSSPDGVILEFRPSYFCPTSKVFRQIFHGGVNYQITGTFPVYHGENEWLHGLDIWGAVDYFSKKGHSTGLHTKTSITIVPLTLGIKYFFPSVGGDIPVNFYAAGGMKYFFVHTRNHSSHVKKTINVNGMGGVVEAGFITLFKEHLVFDVFASYSFKTLSGPSSHNPAVESTQLNISGFNVGLGIGYEF